MAFPIIEKLGALFVREKTTSVSAMTPQQWWGMGGDMGAFFGGPDIANAQENSAIAFACIERRAGDIAGVPLVLTTDKHDLSKALPDSDPVAQLINEPCTGFNGEQMISLMATFYLLRGEAFLVGDAPVKPKALYPAMDPASWRARETQRGVLAGWRYESPKFQADYLPGEVMQVRTTNAGSPYRGLAPLQSASWAMQIDNQGDKLQAKTLDQGGERNVVWTYDIEKQYTPDQLQMLSEQIKSRRRGNAEPSRDVFIPKLEPVDPRFTQADIDVLAHQKTSADKICYVYKVPKFLLGDAQAPNYATAKLLVEGYWQGVVLSDLRRFEASFARFLSRAFPGTRAVAVFDRSKIPALQADMLQQTNIGKNLAALNVPFTEINRVCSLGINDELVVGGDDPLVSAALVPMSVLIDEAHNPPPAPVVPAAPVAPPPEQPKSKALTNAMIQKRAKSPRAIIARNRRLGRMERALKADWRELIGGYKERAGKIADSEAQRWPDVRSAATAIVERLKADLLQGLEDDIAKTITPYHIRAATEGALAIQEIASGKEFSQEDRDWFSKAPAFNAAAQAAVARRHNFVRGMAHVLFGEIRDWLEAAVNDGSEVSELGGRVVHSFNVSANRAATIARTEVGTAYNVARYTETAAQGFTHHEWMTNQDELVRDGDGEDFDHAICDGEVRAIGEAFPCGLEHPQQEGGDPGNVINCRCECIPAVVDEQPFQGDEE